MDFCENCSRNNTNDDSDASNRTNYLRNSSTWPLRRQSPSLAAPTLLLVLFATLIPLSLASMTCKHHEYWDTKLDDCVTCTKCNKHQIVIRPCQPHMDTLCKPLNAVEIDWSKSMASEKPTRHHHPTIETFSAQASTLNEEEAIWDWQMVSLVLAFIACLMFFVGTALIAINYVRQWRKIKKQFDTDIEGLSQQLMARLAMPSSDGNAIFIDDPTSKRTVLGQRQIEVRCVYLEDIIDGKESLTEPKGSKLTMLQGPTGNVYIKDHEQQQHHIILGHKLV